MAHRLAEWNAAFIAETLHGELPLALRDLMSLADMNPDTPRPITASDWRNATTLRPGNGQRVEITKDKVHTAIVHWPPKDRKKWPMTRLWWRPIPFERVI